MSFIAMKGMPLLYIPQKKRSTLKNRNSVRLKKLQQLAILQRKRVSNMHFYQKYATRVKTFLNFQLEKCNEHLRCRAWRGVRNSERIGVERMEYSCNDFLRPRRRCTCGSSTRSISLWAVLYENIYETIFAYIRR